MKDWWFRYFRGCGFLIPWALLGAALMAYRLIRGMR